MKTQPPLADKGPHRDPGKERTWRQHFRQFAASGQTVRRFCAAHRLPESAFYFWRSEIQRRDGQTPPRRQHVTPRPARPLDFARVLVEPPTAADCLRLRLSSRMELFLPMVPEQVASLVRALEATA